MLTLPFPFINYTYYGITKDQVRAWVLKAKNDGDGLGLGEVTIQGALDTQSKQIHIISSINHTFCARIIKNSFSITYINLWLKENVCIECKDRVKLPDRQITLLAPNCRVFCKYNGKAYERELHAIAGACLWAEKIKSHPPAKYTEEWQKAIHAYGILKTYFSLGKQAEPFLQKSINDAKETLKKYLLQKPANLLDAEFIEIIKQYLNTEESTSSVKNKLSTSSKQLVRVRTKVTANLFETCLFGIESIKEENNTISMLLPTVLVQELKKQTTKKTIRIETLGVILETDSQKILETALNLNMPADEALKAARLLCQ